MVTQPISGPYNDPNFVTREQIPFYIPAGTTTKQLGAFPNNVRIRQAQATVALTGSASNTGKFYAGTVSIGQWAGSASTAGFTINVPDMNAALAAGTVLALAITGDNTSTFNVILEVHTDPVAGTTWSGP